MTERADPKKAELPANNALPVWIIERDHRPGEFGEGNVPRERCISFEPRLDLTFSWVEAKKTWEALTRFEEKARLAESFQQGYRARLAQPGPGGFGLPSSPTFLPGELYWLADHSAAVLRDAIELRLNMDKRTGGPLQTRGAVAKKAGRSLRQLQRGLAGDGAEEGQEVSVEWQRRITQAIGAEYVLQARERAGLDATFSRLPPVGERDSDAT